MHLSHAIWTWVGVFMTLAVLSFLYKDNPFYRFAEHLWVGIGNGYSLAFSYHRVLLPMMLKPWIHAFGIAHQKGLSPELFNPLTPSNFLLIVPGLFGCLYFMRFVPKCAWLVRLPIGMFMGYYLGYQFPAALEGSVFPQMAGTLVTKASFANSVMTGVWALVVLVGVIGTLTYFFFSKEHKGALKWGAKTGIVFVMVGFGASFGFTVMARISLAIGRFMFLMRDWLGIIS